MLTPAISASSTSDPAVIIWNAFSTQVCGPPFLNVLPLLDEMTTGFTLFGVITGGAWPNSVFGTAAAAAAAAVVVWTNSRRFSFFIGSFPVFVAQPFRAARGPLAGLKACAT